VIFREIACKTAAKPGPKAGNPGPLESTIKILVMRSHP